MLWDSKIALVVNPLILMAGAVVLAVTEVGKLQEEAEAELQLQAGMAAEHQCLLVDSIVLRLGALQEVSLIRFLMFNLILTILAPAGGANGGRTPAWKASDAAGGRTPGWANDGSRTGNLVPRLPLMVCNKTTSTLVRRHLATLEVILGAAPRHQLINIHPTPTTTGDQLSLLPMVGALLTTHQLQEDTCLRQLPQL
jgi:hypothetical protein